MFSLVKQMYSYLRRPREEASEGETVFFTLPRYLFAPSHSRRNKPGSQRWLIFFSSGFSTFDPCPDNLNSFSLVESSPSLFPFSSCLQTTSTANFDLRQSRNGWRNLIDALLPFIEFLARPCTLARRSPSSHHAPVTTSTPRRTNLFLASSTWARTVKSLLSAIWLKASRPRRHFDDFQEAKKMKESFLVRP